MRFDAGTAQGWAIVDSIAVLGGVLLVIAIVVLAAWIITR